MNGLNICKKLRGEHGYQTPLLMLTTLGKTDDIVNGLTVGADDYSKPFKFPELLARVNALARRKTVINKSVAEFMRAHEVDLRCTINNKPGFWTNFSVNVFPMT